MIKTKTIESYGNHWYTGGKKNIWTSMKNILEVIMILIYNTLHSLTSLTVSNGTFSTNT